MFTEDFYKNKYIMGNFRVLLWLSLLMSTSSIVFNVFKSKKIGNEKISLSIDIGKGMYENILLEHDFDNKKTIDSLFEVEKNKFLNKLK